MATNALRADQALIAWQATTIDDVDNDDESDVSRANVVPTSVCDALGAWRVVVERQALC